MNKKNICVLVGAALASQSIHSAENWLSDQIVHPSLLTGHSFNASIKSAKSNAAISTDIQLIKQINTQSFVWNTGKIQNIPLNDAKPISQQYSDSLDQYFKVVGAAHGVNKSALTTTAKTKFHDTGRGALVASYQQTHQGLEVFSRSINIVVNRKNELIASSGYFTNYKQAPVVDYQIDSNQAMNKSIDKKRGFELPSLFISNSREEEFGNLNETTEFNGIVVSDNSRVKKVWYPTSNDLLLPAYYVELESAKEDSRDSTLYSYVVDGRNGNILFENNMTAHVTTTYKVFADNTGSFIPFDGPQGNALTPHPTGETEDTPANASTFVNANTVTLDHAGLSTADPWLTVSETTTAGNNVDAYADISGNNGFDDTDVRPDMSSANAFEYDFGQFAAGLTGDGQKHAVVDLFYVNNFLHDWFYDSGFDEQAGNAQNNNFGRGGFGNDRLLVEAQDSSGTNNANMSTPSDGGNPRMQMFLWTFLSDAQVTISGVSNIGTLAASFGPQEYDVSGVMSLVDDGTDNIRDGCETITTDLTAKIAIIDRGDCNFTVKVKNAQDKGAVGVIMVNNVTGGVITQGGEDETVTIPSMMVSLEKGDEIKAALVVDDTLQATLFNEARPIDGTLDHGIVAHEWGHYLSNRLVGNANGLSNTQGRSMGEGWSDFVALLMTTKEDDNLIAGNENYQGVYSASTFVGDAYDGIRRAPYSTDMSKNALTFKHIEDRVSLPLNHPVSFGVSGASNSEVHATGEIWANALWEVYVGLINKPGSSFSAAQQQMKDYLIASLKLTPNAPTLLEARDALLAATLATDAEDFEIARTAFAKRGMGAAAVAPDRNSDSHIGVVEDFSTGDDLIATVSIQPESIDIDSCDFDGILDPSESVTLEFGFENYSAKSIPEFSVDLSTAADATFDSSVTVSALAGFGSSTTATAQLTLNNASFMDDMVVTATFQQIGISDQEFNEPAPISITLPVNFDLSKTSTSDDMSSAVLSNADWQVESTIGIIPFVVDNGVWHGQDTATGGSSDLISPAIQVAAQGDLVIDFDHNYSFETDDEARHWDGGVVEISVSGGEWQDVVSFGASLSSGYNGTIEDSNAIIGSRNAFVDTNNTSGFSLLAEQITIPDGLVNGQSIRIRFRIGADANTGGFGWQIDNFTVSNASLPMFSEAVVDDGVCGSSNAPVVSAGSDITIVSRDDSMVDVDLLGAASDPDGDPLTFSWSQLSGPIVTLQNNTSLSPNFSVAAPTQNTAYVFQLVADDGARTASDSITVNINLNQAPVVSASGGSVDEGNTFTLSGTSSDNEADNLTYQWTQTGGPTVTLADSTSLSTTFTAPQVDTNTLLTFELVANDGDLDSSAVNVTVTVTNQQALIDDGKSGGGSLSVFGLLLFLLKRRNVEMSKCRRSS
ncbi:MAG: M36 family metallopeptidase [Kangiellaceae bacterium]|nr:M36 family metallopeptidase [Kangiellaceae bacterium]